jgi:hypothetical protein
MQGPSLQATMHFIRTRLDNDHVDFKAYLRDHNVKYAGLSVAGLIIAPLSRIEFGANI